MRYYDFHERVYRKLREQSFLGWGKKASLAAFDDFSVRAFLAEAIAAYFPRPQACRALEIGCGTGPVTQFLAAQGFDTVGIDVSATAVAMARDLAAQRGSSAAFATMDLLALPGALEKFDLIVDANCLHCLVPDADRLAALRAVAASLRSGGLFVLETMVLHPNVDFTSTNPHCKFVDGILWSKAAPEDAPMQDLESFDGVPHFPQRRIVSVDHLTTELIAAGFTVTHSERLVQNDADPDQMRLVCASV